MQARGHKLEILGELNVLQTGVGAHNVFHLAVCVRSTWKPMTLV